MLTASFAATPVRQQAVHSRKIASASSSLISFRLLYLMKSSREVITRGRLEIVKTVEPCEEKVCSTVWSRPLIIVTTAMTAVTPTMILNRVSAVRSLFWRRLDAATMKASHSAATRRAGNERRRAGKDRRLPKPSGSGDVSLLVGIAAILLDLLVFFDQSVADRDDATCSSSDVMLVRDQDDGVALFVELLKEVHDVVTRGCVERAGRFIGKQN